MQDSQGNATFSSFMTTVLTLLGVAVGLGNVWRFPYMMGSYGGSAFLLLFVLLMVIVGVPALMCELALARAHRGGTITVMHKGFGPFGRVLGYGLVAGVLTAGSYYPLIVGNVFFSAWYVILNGFTPDNLDEFGAALGNKPVQFIIGLAVLWASLFVIWRGLKRGIERVSETFVPFFFLVACYLVYTALSLPGAGAAVLEFMQPDFSAIGITELFAALGQVFFSIGLGASFALVYGKFISADTNLGGVAALSAGGDTLASLLATLFIIPTVILFNLELNSGPTMLFETVPALIAQMPAGRVVGSFLLLSLSLVAFLSCVAIYQVISVALEEEPIGRALGRPRLLLLIGVVQMLMMVYPAWHPEIIGILDLIVGSGFMVTGGLFAVLAITWSYGRSRAMQEIFTTTTPSAVDSLVFLWMRYAIPVALIGILGATFLGAISGE